MSIEKPYEFRSCVSGSAYRTAHTCPDLLAQAAFGQPELNRAALDEMHDRRIAGFGTDSYRLAVEALRKK